MRSPRYADFDACSRASQIRIRSISTLPSTHSPERKGLLTGTKLALHDSLRYTGSLAALDPNEETAPWASRFLELKDSDIRGPGLEEDEPSEGRIVTSWIWLIGDFEPPDGDANPGAGNDLSQRAASGEEVAISIWSHWARCQARAERYEEEVELTVEEMRRTLEFFKWKSRWWLQLQDVCASSATPPAEPQVEHGLRAYAHRQASIYSSLATAYVDHWREFLL